MCGRGHGLRHGRGALTDPPAAGNRCANVTSGLPADVILSQACVIVRCLDEAHPTSTRSEGPIRTLSVSLLAVAAIAASLLLTRTRGDEGAELLHAGEIQPVKLPLDAIRAAGL